MKAIIHHDGTFRDLVPDTTITDPLRTRTWVPASPPELTDTQTAEWTVEVTETEARQVWSVRDKTSDERRYKIAPLTLLDRLARAELKAVIGMALGTTAEAVTDTQEGAWRLMLSLGATGELYSDGRASLVLPGLFGSTRAAELLAPDPTFQPS